MTSAEAVNRFQDESCDFIYIDGNHEYSIVEEDIRIWYPKVKIGGYLCGDDVYSHDLSEHDTSGNVTRIWSIDSSGTPTCWGKYGTYAACVANEKLYNVKFSFKGNQFSLLRKK